MAVKAKCQEDAPMASAAAVRAMVDVTRDWQNLEKDLKLLRARIDGGADPDHLLAATLSATLFGSQLLASLVRMQIALADEE